MNTLKLLEQLGLTEQEANIYLAALKLGTAKASSIAAEAGIKRTTVYHELKLLAHKGFVSVQYIGKERQYRAQSPKKVAHHYQKKVNEFEAIIPQLQSLERKQVITPGIRFLETVSELEHFYEEILQEYAGKTYFIIGDAEGWQSISPEFIESYRHKRAQAKIKTKILLTANSAGKHPTDPTLLRDVRYLPKGFTCKSTLDIFNEKVLIVSPALKSLAVVIEIKAMTDIFKMLFQILWQKA